MLQLVLFAFSLFLVFGEIELLSLLRLLEQNLFANIFITESIVSILGVHNSLVVGKEVGHSISKIEGQAFHSGISISLEHQAVGVGVKVGLELLVENELADEGVDVVLGDGEFIGKMINVNGVVVVLVDKDIALEGLFLHLVKQVALGSNSVLRKLAPDVQIQEEVVALLPVALL